MVEPLVQLAAALSRLPTIGNKSALRLSYFLLDQPQEMLDDLSARIRSIKDEVTICGECYGYAERSRRCTICASTSRDHGIVCIVEKPADVFSIEKSGRYRGVYHVLGGVLSPINGITADKLKISQLVGRVDSGAVHEVILGLGAGADAETTALYIARLLSAKSSSLRITRLARGLPAGMELEYVDQLTLDHALHERTDIRYDSHS